MFERFTEAARRALFFARYEATQLGSVVIGSEHLLLGLAREPHVVVASLLAMTGKTSKALREEIEAECKFREKVPTSIEIPFSADAKRALEFTADEANGLHHSYIGPEHLLLGMMRVEGSLAEKILSRNGMRLHALRDELVRLMTGPMAGLAPRDELLNHVARIRSLVDRLFEAVPNPKSATEIAHAIQVELSSLVAALTPPESQ